MAFAPQRPVYSVSELPSDLKHPHFVEPVPAAEGSAAAAFTLQQTDGHAYWEFNYTTNWIHPLYELPFTGGIPGTFQAGEVGAMQSIVPGSGPWGITHDPVRYGDNPNMEDPCASVGSLQRQTRAAASRAQIRPSRRAGAGCPLRSAAR